MNRRELWSVQMPSSKYAAYDAADPYFNLVRRALADLVEGEHFFDIVTKGTIYEGSLRSRLASRDSGTG